MYAIIRTGGKQAKVRPGDVIDVEVLKGASEEVEFEPLLVVDEAGKTHAGRAKPWVRPRSRRRSSATRKAPRST